jgi:hypothetical protein
MVIARFQFKPGAADQFCWAAGQEIVEMTFEDATEVVQFCKEVEDVIVDCTVIVGDQLLVLSGFTS